MLDVSTLPRPPPRPAWTSRSPPSSAPSRRPRGSSPGARSIPSSTRSTRPEFPREVMTKAGELASSASSSRRSRAAPGSATSSTCSSSPSCRRVDPSVGISVAAHNSLCSNHIYKFGNEEQRERWLRPLAAGKKIGAWSLTEPNAGSDAGRHPHAAPRRWTAAGSSTAPRPSPPTAASATSASSSRSPSPTGRRGHNISAFVLDKGMEGFRPGKKENKLGIRASDTAEVVMENCFVPDDRLLGKRGEGFIQALRDPRRRPHLDRRARPRHRDRRLRHRRSPTPRSASSSASRSPSSRPSSSTSPRWRPRSPPPRR